MHDNDKIHLGSKVIDRLTGFSGVLVGRSEFLYAEDAVLVQSEEILDGKPGPAVWFDSSRIKRTDMKTACPVMQTQKEAE